MKILENIKEFAGKRAIRERQKTFKRSIATCSMDSAEKIGILFNATQMVSFEVVKELVKSISGKKKQIEVLGFVDSKQLVDHYLYRKGFQFFTRKQLNWYYRPLEESVEKFINTEFDLLLDLSLDDPFPMQYILACSRAKFKAGRYSADQQYLDFMIDIEKEKSAMTDIKKELAADEIKNQVKNGEMEKIINTKIQTEIQLNFLINQLIHYLSLLKK